MQIKTNLFFLTNNLNKTHHQLPLELVNWCHREITTHKMLHLQEGKYPYCMKKWVYNEYFFTWRKKCFIIEIFKFTFWWMQICKIYNVVKCNVQGPGHYWLHFGSYIFVRILSSIKIKFGQILFLNYDKHSICF